ncbi:MAG: DUF4266 domain-containing protein [Chitinophagaceae bacterium]
MKNKLPLLFLTLIVSSCASLKPYEMVYVNDPEMKMSGSNGKNFELYIESIREGASPSDGGKSSGGCGCN